MLHDLTTVTFFFCFFRPKFVINPISVPLSMNILNNGYIQLVSTFFPQTPTTSTAEFEKIPTFRVPKIYTSTQHGWVDVKKNGKYILVLV